MSKINGQTLTSPLPWASVIELLDGVKVDEIGVKEFSETNFLNRASI